MEKIYDLIIVGAGAAGLSAAIYGARANLSTAVIDSKNIFGGQMLNTPEIDNYPGLPSMSGFELSEKFYSHASKYNVDFFEEKAEKLRCEKDIKSIICKSGSILKGKTVIIASGGVHRKLGVPGEERLLGKGVGYCASCDGALFREKEVFVAGGGDTAFVYAIYLSRICSRVHLIHRRDKFRAAESYVARLRNMKNADIITNEIIKSINGNEKVESITVMSGSAEKEYPADGIFIAIGVEPDKSLYEEILDTDPVGFIIAKEDCKTSVEGIFAAGDVRSKYFRQISTAVGDGACAAHSAELYLER